uniref:Uncharacterized protein n=1 Tax=Rhizophora mucronata TaxID=61149 RepID=A0A2P2Q2B2_RHIMU
MGQKVDIDKKMQELCSYA